MEASPSPFRHLRRYPFEKGPHVSAVGVFGTGPEFENDLRPKEFPPEVIKSSLWPKLEIAAGLEGLRLKPSKWVATGGVWWKEVEVRDWKDLVRLFPQRPISPAPNLRPAASTKVGPKVRLAIQLIQKIWPNGSWTSVNREKMLETLRPEVRQHAAGLSSDNISAETLKRAIRVLKAEPSSASGT